MNYLPLSKLYAYQAFNSSEAAAASTLRRYALAASEQYVDDTLRGNVQAALNVLFRDTYFVHSSVFNTINELRVRGMQG